MDLRSPALRLPIPSHGTASIWRENNPKFVLGPLGGLTSGGAEVPFAVGDRPLTICNTFRFRWKTTMVDGFDMTLPLVLQLVFGWLCLVAVGAGLICAIALWTVSEAPSRDALSGFSRRDNGLRLLGSRLRALLPIPALRPVPVAAINHRHRARPGSDPVRSERLLI